MRAEKSNLHFERRSFDTEVWRWGRALSRRFKTVCPSGEVLYVRVAVAQVRGKLFTTKAA